MVLVCHMNLQDHSTKGASNFFGWIPLMVSHYLAKFGSHRSCGNGDKWF